MKKWSLLFALMLFLPSCGSIPDLPCPPFCGGEPSAPYDCANPPALSGLVEVDDPVEGEYIVVLRDTPGVRAFGPQQMDLLARDLGGLHVETFSTVRGFSASFTEAKLATALADSRVEYVQQVARRSVAPRAGPMKVEAWGIDRIDQRQLPLDGVFEPGATGAGVNVAIVDTGVSEHPDFTGRLQEDCFTAHTFGGCQDMHGHGTHVAGTTAGATFGVAREASIWAVRVLDADGRGTDTDVIRGIEWVSQKKAELGGQWVINMSLGGGASPALDAAVCSSIESGVVNAVAAGNDSSDANNGSPARVVQAITLGASDDSDRSASFSNYGPGVNLYMPGVDIRSAKPGGGSAIFSGTSMAAPHAAGAAALVFQRHPEYTPAEVGAWLVDNGTPDAISAPDDTTKVLGYVRAE